MKPDNKEELIRCIFHEEKTPSLLLKHKEDSFYCFSCGKKGKISEHYLLKKMDYEGSIQKILEIENDEHDSETAVLAKQNSALKHAILLIDRVLDNHTQSIFQIQEVIDEKTRENTLNMGNIVNSINNILERLRVLESGIKVKH